MFGFKQEVKSGFNHNPPWSWRRLFKSLWVAYSGVVLVFYWSELGSKTNIYPFINSNTEPDPRRTTCASDAAKLI